jgi:hypothetical protein
MPNCDWVRGTRNKENFIPGEGIRLMKAIGRKPLFKVYAED